MRTVYLGTSDFAATVLDRLAASPHRPQLVVTRPDAPRGRGRKLAPPPVAETAELLGIEVFQPRGREQRGGQRADRGRRARGDRHLRLRRPHQGAAALRARDAERAPLAAAALARRRSRRARHRGGRRGDGRLDHAADRGVRRRTRRGSARRGDPPRRQLRLARTAARRAGRRAARGGARPRARRSATSPTPALPTRRRSARTTAGSIRSSSADLLERRVRALTPHIGAYVELPWDERLGVTRAALAPGDGPPPGELAIDDGRLLYGAASGALELQEVHPAGKRPMDAEAWIRGYGERIGRIAASVRDGSERDSLAADGETNHPDGAGVPLMRRALAARHEPPRRAIAASTAYTGSSCARSARTAALTRRSRECQTPRTSSAATAAARCSRPSDALTSTGIPFSTALPDSGSTIDSSASTLLFTPA